MKHCYLIGGTMGVGKTTVCQLLKKRLPNAVFLDGDWCWDADPFQVTEETKMMVVDNICHLLNNFLSCSVYDNIIFCWVMHQQEIIDDICSRLNLSEAKLHCISLICDEDSLCQRLKKDVADGIRQEDVIARSVQRLPLYEKLRSEKVDTTAKSPEEIAAFIAEKSTFTLLNA